MAKLLDDANAILNMSDNPMLTNDEIILLTMCVDAINNQLKDIINE